MLEYFERSKKVTKIGVLVRDLRLSTLTYSLIDLGNRLVNTRPDIDFYVFHSDWKTPPKSVSFPLMQYRNAWGFEGILVSTNIDTTLDILNFPNVDNKFFYIWDMYQHLTLPNLHEIKNIYFNPNIHLIARSYEYAKIISKNFNRVVSVAEDFDSEEFLNIIK